MIMPKYDEPGAACVVVAERCVDTSGSGASRSSEGVWDIIINIDEGVRVGSEKGCVDGRIGRRYVAEEEISMSMEESTRESFCEMVRHINFRVDALEQHQVPVNPFAE